MSTLRHARNPPPAERPPAERPTDALRPANRASNEFVERVQTKVHAIVWVAAAALLLTKGEVIEAAASPARSSPFFIYLGLTLLGVVLTLMVYCVVWVRRVHGSQWPLRVVAPGLVEAAAASGVGCLLSLTVGLWPAYGLLTPLVVGTLGMGGLFSLHFVPNCGT